MSVYTEINTQEDQDLVTSIFERIGADLSMVIDREIVAGNIRAERANRRAVGEDQVHISFKLAIQHGETTHQGCLLVPLPEAIALSAYLMMMPDDIVALERRRTDVDRPMKEALLEVGNFVAGACDAVLRKTRERCSVRPAGCQGVRANVRPALSYNEGDELVVGRASGHIGNFGPFEMILQLPALDG